MKKYFLICACTACLSPGLFSQQSDTTLQRYIATALRVSPRLMALHSRQNAYGSRIAQASNLPDPRVAFTLNNLPVNSFSFTQEPMTGKMISLSQEFPFPGKLSARESIAAGDEKIAEQETGDARLELTRDVKQTYNELAYLAQAIRIQEQARQIYREFARVVRTKYEVGKGSQQDILKSDLEVSRTTEKIISLQERRNALTATLNSLLLNDPATPLSIDSLQVPETFTQLTEASLIEKAKANRPLLMGLQAAQQKAAAQRNLATLAWYPDFTVGAAYTQRDYMKTTNTNFVDFASVSVTMNIPLNYGGKRTAAEDEAQSTEQMYEYQYNSAIQSLQKLFGKSIAAINSITDRLDLLETGLLPQASQTLTASLAGYQVSEVDYLTVLDNQAKLFQMETDVYRLRADYWKEIAEIEFLSGTEKLQ